jgi:hypothetical protein
MRRNNRLRVTGLQYGGYDEFAYIGSELRERDGL